MRNIEKLSVDLTANMDNNKDLKLLLKKFAEESTTHGIAPIQSSESKCSKVLSIAIFLFLFTCLTVSAVTSIKGYFNYDTVTSVTVQHSNHLEFPAITICPNNKISKKYMPENVRKMVEEKLKAVEVSGNYTELVVSMKKMDMLIKTAMKNNKLNISNEPPWIADYVDACVFASKTRCNTSADFKCVTKANGYTRCHTFNLGVKAKYYQNGNGPLFGLSLVLYVDQQDYVPLGGNEDGAGFTIYIHRHDTPHNLMGGGILVSPGQITRVSLTRSETVLKPHPYPSNCSDGKGVRSYFPGQYSRDSCKVSCLSDLLYEKCGYANEVLRGANKNVEYPNTTVEMLTCERKILSDFQDLVEKCDCPLPCVRDRFIPLVSTSTWPADADLPTIKYMFASTLKYHPTNVTDDLVRKQVAKVSIFYEKLSVQRIAESAKTSEVSLLSDVGGLLGLWIGSSLYSLAQVVGLFFGMVSLILTRTPIKTSVVTVASKQPSI